MKKVICIALSVAICVIFVACSSNSEKASITQQTNSIAYSQTETKSTTQNTTIPIIEPNSATESTTLSTTKHTTESYYDTTAHQVQAHVCGACGGSGQIYSPIYDANGIPIQEYIACGACAGTGWIYY